MNHLEVNVETDKKLNIYALWQGTQILLCKGKEKSTIINGEKWVCLWPGRAPLLGSTTTDKSPTEFKRSPKGNALWAEIENSDIPNSYVARVEYIPINGKQRAIWEELEKIGEFELWDIDQGPMKYFTNKGRNYIALYQVFKLKGFHLKADDTVADKHGNLRTHYKKLTEKASELLKEALKARTPIIPAEVFKKRRDQIMEIARKYPAVPGVTLYRRKATLEKNETSFSTIPRDRKFCVYCGKSLVLDAVYCSQCGKKQSEIV